MVHKHLAHQMILRRSRAVHGHACSAKQRTWLKTISPHLLYGVGRCAKPSSEACLTQLATSHQPVEILLSL